MPISRETLQEIATARQLQPATLERVIRLLDILDAFGSDSFIGPRIALKGGTALNVFYADLPRLSVDIDLNYIGALEKERMDEDRPKLEDRIERLMASKGYTARREPTEHAGGKWLYRYASALGGGGVIEIDINYLFRGPLYGVNRLSSVKVGTHQARNVPVLDIHEIIAGKIVALITRQTARDVFDAARIVDMPDLDWIKIKVATLMIGASARSFDWRTASPDAIVCETRDITEKLTMCLTERYFDALGGRDKWLTTAIDKSRRGLAKLFKFTKGEMAFLGGVLDEGRIDPSVLNVPDDLRAAIAACPALRWKAQNVAARIAGGPPPAKQARRKSRTEKKES